METSFRNADQIHDITKNWLADHIPGSTVTRRLIVAFNLLVFYTHHSCHCCADHYQGITENWDAGLIYCSEVTGTLIVHMLGVNAMLVRRLPMDTPVTVQGGDFHNRACFILFGLEHIVRMLGANTTLVLRLPTDPSVTVQSGHSFGKFGLLLTGARHVKAPRGLDCAHFKASRGLNCARGSPSMHKSEEIVFTITNAVVVWADAHHCPGRGAVAVCDEVLTRRELPAMQAWRWSWWTPTTAQARCNSSSGCRAARPTCTAATCATPLRCSEMSTFRPPSAPAPYSWWVCKISRALLSRIARLNRDTRDAATLQQCVHLQAAAGACHAPGDDSARMLH